MSSKRGLRQKRRPFLRCRFYLIKSGTVVLRDSSDRPLSGPVEASALMIKVEPDG